MVDLVLQGPERGKPQRHLLDLSRPERREAMSDLGLPAFRADQVS
ncbi:MAG: 23S rRNA (adenine(2503)-C(2))-methyltransferase RlmN, partial [Micrococcales bacterium]|nr:23S rRNA (adenine(2503)-C(2))-methyltransferase RlmN [Micrococcales bacterium]